MSGNNDNVESRPQSPRGLLPGVRDDFHFRHPRKTHTGSRRRKQTSEARQSRRPQCDATEEPKQPERKKLKASDDLNEYRRQRNLKNLMMINRLESNIGRMEARLQELGFDIDSTANPSSISRPDNILSPRSPAFPQLEGTLNEEIGHTHSGATLRSTVTDMDWDLHEPEPSEGMYGSAPDEDFIGLYIPKCLMDTPTAKALSALSHEGFEWVSQKTGVTPMPPLGQRYEAMPHAFTHGLFPRKAFWPLPSREEATSILHEYIQNFNSFCPLFQPDQLVSLFHEDRLDIIAQTPAHWACVNIVLALGIAFRIKDRSLAQAEHQKSWLFVKNALSVLHHLCLGQPDLWSVQAILGLAIFFLGTMSSEPCSFLVSAAIRLSHQIGLERIDEGTTLSPEEMVQRRNIFWIAYCLDREMSLRFGKPLAQNDDDLNVGLPTETLKDSDRGLPTKDPHGSFDVFRAHCQLATIKGQLYKNLYSAAAKDRSIGDIITSVGALDEKLQHWREKLPPEYQPEVQASPNFPQSSISVMLLYLHYSYFNCVIAIHRLIASRGITTGTDLFANTGTCTLVPPSGNPRLFTSASLCANAARASIKLMRYMPEGHVFLVGFMMHYPVVALTTLSSTIIQNPRDISRVSDMKLLGQVETFLSSVVLQIPEQVINRLRAYCAEYRSAAEAAVQKVMQFPGT